MRALCEFMNVIMYVCYSTVSCALKRMINTEMCWRPQNLTTNHVYFANVSMKQNFTQEPTILTKAGSISFSDWVLIHPQCRCEQYNFI